jgi:hypothetical protein
VNASLIIAVLALAVVGGYIGFEIWRVICGLLHECPQCSEQMNREGRAMRCPKCGCVVTTGRYEDGKFSA